MTFENILKRKIDYYGKTEAAYEFAAEEWANHKVIEELEKIPPLMIQPLGEEIRLSSYYVLKRIKELKQ